MANRFARLIALFLLPGLLVDPGMAAACVPRVCHGRAARLQSDALSPIPLDGRWRTLLHHVPNPVHMLNAQVTATPRAGHVGLVWIQGALTDLALMSTFIQFYAHSYAHGFNGTDQEWKDAVKAQSDAVLTLVHAIHQEVIDESGTTWRRANETDLKAFEIVFVVAMIVFRQPFSVLGWPVNDRELKDTLQKGAALAYQVFFNYNVAHYGVRGVSPPATPQDPAQALRILLTQSFRRSLQETLQYSDSLLRAYPDLSARWIDQSLDGIRMGMLRPSEAAQLTYALSLRLDRPEFFSTYSDAFRAMGGHIEVEALGPVTYIGIGEPPAWWKAVASPDALTFACDLYAFIRKFGRFGVGAKGARFKLMYAEYKRLEIKYPIYAEQRLRQLLGALLNSMREWNILFDRFTAADREIIADHVVRRMRQEAWHDEVQKRYEEYQSVLAGVYEGFTEQDRNDFAMQVQRLGAEIAAWLIIKAEPAMVALGDPFAYLFESNFDHWLGWHLLGNELEEDWLSYLKDLSRSKKTERSFLILLGMMGDHVRQRLDPEDEIAYRYIFLRVLPWAANLIQESPLDPFVRIVRRVILVSLHINPDPQFGLSLGLRIDGQLGDFSLSRLQEFITTILGDLTPALPNGAQLLDDILTASNDLLYASDEPAIDFIFADCEPQALVFQTGRDLLELYADFVESAGGVKGDGRDAKIWDFFSGLHPFVLAFRGYRQHAMTREEIHFYHQVHRAMRDGTLIPSTLRTAA
jgi:hypothetical protein